MIRFPILIVSIFLSIQLFSQDKPLTYYLPDIEYDQSITTPKTYLGHQIGDWHISHDQIIGYAKLVASQSDRVEYIETGRTHENRPLCVLHISDSMNLNQKDFIQNQHIKLTDTKEGTAVDISSLPLVIYQGYSVHGNEASGVNAAALVLYYLAAGQSEEVNNVLKNTFILFDPCYNPDGVQRFSTWVNSHKGQNLISDPQSREFNEDWPKGRTNHYWFDLNRDWLLLTHPESQARIKTFHNWKPNILTDHHEMGTNSTFFFQPGVPSRTNPNTPWKNQELTEQIGEFHAQALDRIGSQYFTKAQYDDFYYGKGSTYPDIHGSIGILFEQASARGHLQESDNGILSFPFAIRNQVTTSLSTQRAGVALRKELLEYKREFYINKSEDAASSRIKGYSYSDVDQGKLNRFTDILMQHDIKVYSDVNKPNSMVVPCDQKQYGLINTIFEKVTTFKDSIFYDVSAWTMPLAFDLTYEALSNKDLQKLSLVPITSIDELNIGNLYKVDKPYAWVVNWAHHGSPTLLMKLLNKGVICRTSMNEMKLETSKGAILFANGSIIVPAINQTLNKEELRNLFNELCKTEGLDVFEIASGYLEGGITTGGPTIKTIKKSEIFTLVGDGISSYDAGELWHYMDQTLKTNITLIDTRDLNASHLKRYNTLILVNGSYNSLSKDGVDKIRKWTDAGGNIIAMRGSLKFLNKSNIIKLTTKQNDVDKKLHPSRQYRGSSAARGAKVLGGAIFEGRIDMTHPLAFGYSDDLIPLFRKGTSFFESTSNRYATPMHYSEQNPLLSGYIPRGISEVASGSAAATIHQYGDGTIIAFSDNLLFRGYWWGTHKLFANAIFFCDLIESNSKEKLSK